MNARATGPIPTLFLAASCLFAVSFVAAASGADDATGLDDETRKKIVEAVSGALAETYVFEDVANEMIEHIGGELAKGSYDVVDQVPELAQRLTADLQSISHDLHLRVQPLPPGEPIEDTPEAQEERRRRFLTAARAGNYGFRKAEILQGNVGYLDLRGFHDASLGGATAKSVMSFFSGVDALIFDLRQNGGGSPSMIQLISSYLFDEPVHLNSFYIRQGDRTRQFWTQPHVESPKLLDIPVYVLTSRRTFSAAEEFTYNLKNLERATIVGETTGGGAHPVEGRRFPDLGIAMSVPFGRAVNPITGTNWEGTGVEPHVAVPAPEALDVALLEALKTLGEEADPERQTQLEWAIAGIEARRSGHVLDEAHLEDYVGQYGPRRIWVEDDHLQYQRDNGPVARLVPMAEDLFGLDNVDFFRVRFERDSSGRVSRLVGLYEDGRVEPNDRSR